MSAPPSLQEAVSRAQAKPHDPVEEELRPTTVVSIDVKDRRGNRYCHSFYYKVPDLGDRLAIGKATAIWLPNGETPNRTANMLAHIAGYLAVTIKFEGGHQQPTWWDLWKMYDATPFEALYEEVRAYEARFLGIQGDEPRGAGAEDGREEPAHDRIDPPHVGGDVPTPAQRSTTVIAESS